MLPALIRGAIGPRLTTACLMRNIRICLTIHFGLLRIVRKKQRPSIASHSFGIASQQPVVLEFTMTTFPSTAMAPRLAADPVRRNLRSLAGPGLSVAAAAIVLWIALVIH